MSADKYHGGEINIYTSLKIEGDVSDENELRYNGDVFLCNPNEVPNHFSFVEEPCVEVVRVQPDGKVFLYGELVETDEQRIQAFNALVGVLTKSMTRPEE